MLPDQVVIFTLGELRCGFPLANVEKIVRAVEISILPDAPDMVIGIINMAGTVIPVIDGVRRFGFPPRELTIDDRFIIARTAKLLVAVVVDSVIGLKQLSEEDKKSAERVLPFASHLQGVATIDGDFVLIYDLDKFFFPGEEQILKNAINAI